MESDVFILICQDSNILWELGLQVNNIKTEKVVCGGT